MPIDPTVVQMDWIIRAGNNLPNMFRVPEGDHWAHLGGSEIDVIICWPGGEITLVSTAPAEVDDLTYGVWLEDQEDEDWRGFLGVRLTLEQRDMLPRGLKPARYVIRQRWGGERRDLFEGPVIVTGWEGATNG